MSKRNFILPSLILIAPGVALFGLLNNHVSRAEPPSSWQQLVAQYDVRYDLQWGTWVDGEFQQRSHLNIWPGEVGDSAWLEGMSRTTGANVLVAFRATLTAHRSLSADYPDWQQQIPSEQALVVGLLVEGQVDRQYDVAARKVESGYDQNGREYAVYELETLVLLAADPAADGRRGGCEREVLCIYAPEDAKLQIVGEG